MKRLTIRNDDEFAENEIIYNNSADPEGMYNILDLAKNIDNGDGTEAGILLDISQRLAFYEDLEEKGCEFCCYKEYPDKALYPREKQEFYAGRSKQVEVDDFDEVETNEINYCPMCGRKLMGEK